MKPINGSGAAAHRYVKQSSVFTDFWAGFLSVFPLKLVLWLCEGSRFLVVPQVQVCFAFQGDRTCRVPLPFDTCVDGLLARRRL